MLNNSKNLQTQILDRHLSEVRVCDRPSKGWVHAIRTALGMSVRQMGERLGIAQQSAARLEHNEENYSITLASLRKVAEALDCKLVYVLIPNEGSLAAIVKKQANKKATEIIKSVDHTMKLEAQGVGDLDDKISELSNDLSKNINSKLWDLNDSIPRTSGPNSAGRRRKT